MLEVDVAVLEEDAAVLEEELDEVVLEEELEEAPPRVEDARPLLHQHQKSSSEYIDLPQQLFVCVCVCVCFCVVNALEKFL